MNPDFEKKDTLTISSRFELNNLDRITSPYNGRYETVNKPAQAQQILSQLKKHAELALDCEGVRLGRGGKLTLIQIGARNGTVYLFDALVLGKELFTIGMKEILESNQIVKYMFDCKGDSDSLYHEYGIKLANVLDLQIYEFIVRPVAGTSLPIGSRPEHYKAPRVRGLGSAVQCYVERKQVRKIGFEDFFEPKKAGDILMRVVPTLWRYRPLSHGMEKYAALDIEMIWIILDSLQKHQRLTNTTLKRVKIGSEVYVALRRDADKKPDDVYFRHPMMVSYVIPEVGEYDEIKEFPYADTQCDGCRRYFEASFVTRNDLCKDCVEAVRASRYRYR